MTNYSTLKKDRKNTLHLRRVSRALVEDKWGFRLPRIYDSIVYIICNKSGNINWECTNIYSAHQLVEVNKIKIINNEAK